MSNKKIIVVSAVNIIEGGALSILRDFLEYLDKFVIDSSYRVIAIVHNKNQCYFDRIEYIEIPWAKRTWFHRIYCEYFYLKKISERIQVYLWFSLHDTTPNVFACKKAVYCHNPSPFYSPSLVSFFYNYKEYLFSKFYKYIYEINIKKNDYVIVQQNWLKQEFIRMFGLDEQKTIVCYPKTNRSIGVKYVQEIPERVKKDVCTFFFPAFPRTFKNFEIIGQACNLLAAKGRNGYKVYLTIDGTENRYARQIYNRYKFLSTIHFIGQIEKEKVYELYESVDCLIFPSKLETWGLPVSEFVPYKKPMLIADMPYARETASGAGKVCFFNPDKASELARGMEKVMDGKMDEFVSIPHTESCSILYSWGDLLQVLLGN